MFLIIYLIFLGGKIQFVTVCLSTIVSLKFLEVLISPEKVRTGHFMTKQQTCSKMDVISEDKKDSNVKNAKMKRKWMRYFNI